MLCTWNTFSPWLICTCLSRLTGGQKASLSSWLPPVAHTPCACDQCVPGLHSEEPVSGAQVPGSVCGKDRVPDFRQRIDHQMMTLKGLLLQQSAEIPHLIFLSFYWVLSITSSFQLVYGRGNHKLAVAPKYTAAWNLYGNINISQAKDSPT